MVVAAEYFLWTKAAIEFAKYSREVGADVLMVVPYEWGTSNTHRTLVEHFAAVAEHIPVMLNNAAFLSRSMTEALELLKLIKEEVRNVVAIKDDWCNEFSRRMSLLFNDRWAIFAGGQKQNHMNIFPYGCDGYMSTFIKFKPEVAQNYWKAIQSNDLPEAESIIQNLDIPFFDFIGSLQGGFNAGIHGCLELFGIAKRWRRKPFYSLNDEEMERLAGFLREKSLL